MKVVRPKSKEELKRIVEEARSQGKIIYIAAYPCPECEIVDASLEELGADKNDNIIKVDVPPDDWAVEFVLNDLGVPGAPSMILPDGKVLDMPDPVELAMETAKRLRLRLDIPKRRRG